MEPIVCAWEIRAGIIPLQAMQEYTKRFVLTSEEWDGGSEQGASNYVLQQGMAMNYTAWLQNPAKVNWVECTFIWF